MPYPVFDFGDIFTHFGNVVFVLDEQIVHLLEESGARIAELRQNRDRRFDEVEAVDLILYAHIERRRDRAFFHIPEHMQIFIVAGICQLMNESGIAVEVENNGFIFREDCIVIRIGKAVRMYAVRLQFHEVDDIHETDFQIGEIVAQNGGSRKRFERRGISAACDDEIGFGSRVIARPIPDGNALRTMVDSLLHSQPLEAGMFGCNDHIDIVFALYAMVEAREEAVCIGR